MATTIAIDAGTTGVRALVVDESAVVVDVAYRELTQHYPQPGWVEHDAEEIWQAVVATLSEVASRHEGVVAAIGITNQRETVVAFDAADASLLSPALVWQDKRTASRCSDLRAQGHEAAVRSATGLVLDPYFSATKMAWLLESGRLDGAAQPRLGTVDAWIAWRLTGGPGGGAFATDPSNAARTMLYDIDEGGWSTALCELFGVELGLLPELRASCGRIGLVDAPGLERLAGTPLSGILGDQQSALFGQACFEAGMVKATFGTGAFVLAQAGSTRPPTTDGLLTTVAWDLGEAGGRSYALEGSAFVAGAAVQWLRDQLGIIDEASELEALASGCQSSGGLSFIPAFVGLGSPWWDETARGAMVGITRGSGRAELARAVVESLAYEVRAITDAFAAAGIAPTELRCDGGAAAMDLLLELQAQQSGVRTVRPRSLESTAIGAATVAGLAEGVWGSLDELSTCWGASRHFEADDDRSLPDALYAEWCRALERSRGWA